MKRRSSTKAPPDPEFFVDRDLGPNVTSRLKAAGFIAHDHDSYFQSKTRDVDWIPQVCARQWVILSSDKSMRRNWLEIDCLMRCGARAIYPGGNVRYLEFADLLVRSRNRMFQYIHRQFRTRSGPYLARLRRDEKALNTAPGKIETWVDEAKWKTEIKRRG